MIKPNFRHEINGKKLATAIAQDYKTNEILMLAFIDEEAFFGCDSLGQVYIPPTTKIADTAFRNCPGLVIRGEKDSPAEKYAKEHNIVFQPEQ